MVHFLDITKEHCPMTFVKVKLKLEQLAAGDRLEVLLNEGEPLSNVPKSARQQGCKVISITPDQPPFHRVVIEK
ncbi:MAG: sulfurtransferase TusA family protein [Lentisphaerae bacterium]|nr:sulfurtransferase TusA family protein [Lentisphaerota bacterium]